MKFLEGWAEAQWKIIRFVVLAMFHEVALLLAEVWDLLVACSLQYFSELLDWQLVCVDCGRASLLGPGVSPALARWELVQARDWPTVWVVSSVWPAIRCHSRPLGSRPVKALSRRSQGAILQHLHHPCKGFVMFFWMLPFAVTPAHCELGMLMRLDSFNTQKNSRSRELHFSLLRISRISV